MCSMHPSQAVGGMCTGIAGGYEMLGLLLRKICGFCYSVIPTWCCASCAGIVPGMIPMCSCSAWKIIIRTPEMVTPNLSLYSSGLTKSWKAKLDEFTAARISFD